MSLLNSRVSRIALACSFIAAVAAAQPAMAQVVSDEQIPLSDFCQVQPGSNCTEPVIGTRTVTPTSNAVITPIPGGIDLRATYNVDFEGTLQVDGMPVAGAWPAPSWLLSPLPEMLDVQASANYDVNVHYHLGQRGVDVQPDTSFSFNSLAAIKLGVDIENEYFEDAEGREGSFNLRSINPTAIVNNSTALTGSFAQTEGVIRFGTLSGTASLVGNPGVTDIYGQQFISPYALQVDLTSHILTQLDEHGLITPKIAVTDGIEMNGSKITGLAAGTQGSDAVNLAQLKAATANFVTNNSGGPAPTARGQGAIAAGSGTSANGMGAIAMGYQNVAEGDGAVAIGDPNIATGKGAVAIGANNVANGNGSVAIGNGSIAAHSGNLAMGNAANADGSNAVALGSGSAALGNRSTAVGTGATAAGADSVAIGYGSVADQSRTVSVGAAGSERRVVNVAAGTGATDAVNKAQLDAEAQARIAADVGLANDLATEAATRAQADATLNQRIAAEEVARTQLAADLQSEANARAAADLSLATQIGTLGGQLDALAGRVDTLESRVDKLDNKLAASTAVAVAMGGNAFLPNMKFNLTANVATYDGAQAGAFQMGAMVSDNVAVNAGVATSFNKGGKVAGRVGFTVGW